MMRRFAFVLVLSLFQLPSTLVYAQCVIGVHPDAAGSGGSITPPLFTPFDFFVVMHVEGAVEGVAYSLAMPSEIVIVNAWYSPDEDGFEFLTPGGYIVGFGECVLGFGGEPIQVARYTGYIVAPTYSYWESIYIEPNPTEDPSNIVYASCAGSVEPCPGTISLLVGPGGAVESRSFAAVKSLFGS